MRHHFPALADRAPSGALCGRGDFGGAVAQLGERVNGIHEVSGSIPIGSTKSDEHRARV